HPEPSDAFEIYTRLSSEEFRRVDEIATEGELESSEVYESLQVLMDEGLVEYDTMKNGYRRSN
ncbi:MAG: helix-turn-helix domain-containing protein, partial [Halobacteria archaeon]|nr:helix-turn-helix domain-containing protein [Halobacteria archaeon]